MFLEKHRNTYNSIQIIKANVGKMTNHESIISRINPLLRHLKQMFGRGQGECYEVSTFLFHYLKKLGYKPKLIKGTFLTDLPYDYREKKEGGEALHYWIEIEGLILDLTAEQFNDELEDDVMPGILIGTYRDFPQYTKEKELIKSKVSLRRIINAKWTNTSSDYWKTVVKELDVFVKSLNERTFP